MTACGGSPSGWKVKKTAPSAPTAMLPGGWSRSATSSIADGGSSGRRRAVLQARAAAVAQADAERHDAEQDEQPEEEPSHRDPAAARVASAVSNARIRAAFAPRSPCPTRDLERMSTRLPPAGSGRTRMTTSSWKPKSLLVATASSSPACGSRRVMLHERHRRRRALDGDEGRRGIERQASRRQIGAAGRLLRREGRRVREVAPGIGRQRRRLLEGRRIRGVGREVVDPGRSAATGRQHDERERRQRRRHGSTAPEPATTDGADDAEDRHQERDESAEREGDESGQPGYQAKPGEQRSEDHQGHGDEPQPFEDA